MSDVIDLAFEFDQDADPNEATAAVVTALSAMPGATDIDAEPARPMAVDASEVVLTVVAVFGVLKVTVQQLNDLTTDLEKLVRNLRGLRRVMLRAGDEVREVRAAEDTDG